MGKVVELLSIPERWEINVGNEVEDDKMEAFRRREPGTSSLYYAVRIQARSIKSAEYLIIEAQRLLKQERAACFALGPPEETVERLPSMTREVEPLSYEMACRAARFMRVYESFDTVCKIAVAATIFSLEFDHDAQKALRIGEAILRESGYGSVPSEDKSKG